MTPSSTPEPQDARHAVESVPRQPMPPNAGCEFYRFIPDEAGRPVDRRGSPEYSPVDRIILQKSGIQLSYWQRPQHHREKGFPMSTRDPRLTDITTAVLASYGTLQPETAEDREVNAQLIAHLQSWLESNDRDISMAATAVVARFVDAELDFTTDGNRGMGRMTDYWPRFGGKHRSILKHAPASVIRDLHRLFSRQAFCGYLFAEYLVETMSGAPLPRDPASNNHEKFLYQWVPLRG